jgi:tRNA G18 (ribose-2'-O)-methylase SpoU
VIIPIDDPDDPRVAAYRQVRERDLVGREGRFIAEGEVVLAKLVHSDRHRPESVLIAEKRVAGLAPLLAVLDPTIPVYAAGQAVMDLVTGFPIHRGVLAVGRRRQEPEPAALLAALGPRALVVGLFGIANHDNMGGIFRNAAAFGADAVLLAADCCDPFYRKAIRVSVGAALDVPFAVLPRGTDMLDLLEASGFEALALAAAGAETLSGLGRPARAAALFGAEGPGLPQEILARARTVRIPMAPGFDSLNVATTSGIVLHHLMQGG